MRSVLEIGKVPVSEKVHCDEDSVFVFSFIAENCTPSCSKVRRSFKVSGFVIKS